jgi:hypothetical protein
LPPRQSHPGFAIPFRASVGNEVASRWVTRSRFNRRVRSRTILPVFPVSPQVQGCDSLNPALLGLGHPSWLHPNSLPYSGYGHLSWGFFPLQRIRGGELTSQFLGLPRFFLGICRQIPLCPLRRRSQVFATSQRLSSLPAVLPSFRQETLVGFLPSGVYSFREAPASPRCWHTLLTLLLRVGLSSPFLGGDTPQACGRFPRILCPAPFSSSGSSSSRKSTNSRQHC